MRPWLIELASCPSTNTWALEHHAALAHGACVWTQQQTAGRGRGGSSWQAPTGVLTASFVLHLKTATPQLSLAAGLAVCHAVEDLCPGLRVRLKWPNDCLLLGADGSPGKLAGILCERPHEAAGSKACVVVGIGLNLDPQWTADRDALLLAIGRSCPPTSLAEHGATVPPMLAVLDGLRRYLLEAAGLLAADQWLRIVESWRERDVLRGRELTIAIGNEQLRGLGSGIDDQGRLCLQRADGPVALTSGSVTQWASLRRDLRPDLRPDLSPNQCPT
jgi:BirA family biotin operon repressor/biotin-[acetyl-CoA-carboxylase] ligase